MYRKIIYINQENINTLVDNNKINYIIKYIYLKDLNFLKNVLNLTYNTNININWFKLNKLQYILKEIIEKEKNWLQKIKDSSLEKFINNSILHNIPNHIVIEATNNCNLKCIWCNSHLSKRLKWFMEFETFKNIINQIPYKENTEISIQGLWEPLLNKDLIKMLIYAKKQKVNKIELITNWILLNEKLISKLLKTNIDNIIISFDWINQKTYEIFRIWWEFNIILKNLILLIKLKNYYKLKWYNTPIIKVNCVVHKYNESEIEKIKDLCSKIWIDKLLFMTFYSNMWKYNHMIPNKKISYKKLKWDNPCYSPCYNILYNGDFTICYLSSSNLKNLNSLKLGNVNKQSLVEYFSGKKCLKIHEKLFKNKNLLPSCKKCIEPYKLNSYNLYN